MVLKGEVRMGRHDKGFVVGAGRTEILPCESGWTTFTWTLIT